MSDSAMTCLIYGVMRSFIRPILKRPRISKSWSTRLSVRSPAPKNPLPLVQNIFTMSTAATSPLTSKYKSNAFCKRIINNGLSLCRNFFFWHDCMIDTYFNGINSHCRHLIQLFRGPRKTNLIKQILSETFWGRLDVLLFDTPPGTSDEHLTIVKLLRGMAKLDGALVVTTTQEVALGVVRREATFCKQMNLDILGIVQNMAGFACPCCRHITGEKMVNAERLPPFE